MKLYEKLARLRKEKGWSQAELSERVIIQSAHLSRLENNKAQPSIDALYKLAKAYGVSMDYLMDENIDQLVPISIQNKPLAERLEMITQLEAEDQRTIIHVIDSMLTKKKILEAVQSENYKKN